MLVAPAMGPTVVRSSLEVMLDSLMQKDEKPKDSMPALPVRPISKGRLRRLPVNLIIGFEDRNNDREVVPKVGTLSDSELPTSPEKTSRGMDEEKLDYAVRKIASLEEVSPLALQGVICIQKHFRGLKAHRSFQELTNGATTLQSFIRCWQARNHLSVLKSLERSKMKHTETNRSLDFKLQEMVDTNKEQPQAESVVVKELQIELSKAEDSLRIKEEENLALKLQIQQYETRWSDHEAKMKSVEEKWQKQMASLQMSLAAAKRSLAANDSSSQPEKNDRSLDNHYFDSEGANSVVFQTTEGTPAIKARASAVLPINSNVTLHVVSHMVKDFEQQKKDFEDDARFLIDVKSGQSLASMNPDEEFQKLKVRFAGWKKDYKVKLRETKVELQKLGALESVKTRRRWWSLRSAK